MCIYLRTIFKLSFFINYNFFRKDQQNEIQNTTEYALTVYMTSNIRSIQRIAFDVPNAR